MVWHLALAAGYGAIVMVLGYVLIQSRGGPAQSPAPHVDLVPPGLKMDAKMADEVFGAKNLGFNSGVIVHLFEWPWADVARECEHFLPAKGYKAVQISPPTEHRVLDDGPWFERYQVVSYKLESRSGTRAQLEDMVKRCNAKGIRVFAEVVINHMSPDGECKGVSGTTCNAKERTYNLTAGGAAGSSYTKDDFHFPRCDIIDSNNATEVRVCELHKIHDLDQGKENVRKQIVAMMNDLIKIGVAGFRINAAMNIWPDHLFQIYSYLDNLNTAHGLPKHTRPFVYQEVVDVGQGAVKYTEYTPLGMITDARYSRKMAEFMKHRTEPFDNLQHFVGSQSLAPRLESVVYVDDYNTERKMDNFYLNYKQSRTYKMAVAFMLACGHGTPVVMSGYKFDDYNEGPPTDEEGNVVSPSPNEDTNLCDDKWVCQHRWRQIYNMVTFHEATKGETMTYWWNNDKKLMLQFNMGKVGTIAFNFESHAFSTTIKTELPPGEYCDIISGRNENGICSGRTVEVMEGKDANAHIYIHPFNENDHGSDGVLAILDHEISRKPI